MLLILTRPLHQKGLAQLLTDCAGFSHASSRLGEADLPSARPNELPTLMRSPKRLNHQGQRPACRALALRQRQTLPRMISKHHVAAILQLQPVSAKRARGWPRRALRKKAPQDLAISSLFFLSSFPTALVSSEALSRCQ